MHNIRDNSGFVLLIVLLVLAVAGTILAASARRSGRQTLEAGAAQRELQVKWAALSCRAICLPLAEEILKGRSAKQGRPCTRVRRNMVLGGLPLTLILSDEQAKANVNMLVGRHGRSVAAARINQLQAHLRRPQPVYLRPFQLRVRSISAVPMFYASVDQVFVFEHPSQLIEQEADEPSPLDRITCWSSGKVNFKRAEPAVIREATAGLLTEGQLAELVALRNEARDCTLTEAIQHLQLEKEQIEAIKKVLTDTSSCHSLWVIARGPTRKWHRLYVSQRGDMENDSRNWTFQW